MKRYQTPLQWLFFSAMALLLPAPPMQAQSYTAETVELAAPEGFAAAVRETLPAWAIRVTGPDGPVCDIWVRTEIPAKASAAQTFGIAYPTLEEGTFIAVVRLLAPMRDYRRQQLQPGLYTLRYALNPVDGNHMGVSEYRDFLLLAPAGSDAAPAKLAAAELAKLSAKASGTTHPAVWSLLKPEEPPEELPAFEHEDFEDLWVLYFRALLVTAEGAPRRAVFALVVIGHAAEA